MSTSLTSTSPARSCATAASSWRGRAPHDRLAFYRPQRCDDPAPPWPMPHQTVAALFPAIQIHQMLIPFDLDHRQRVGLIDTGAETTTASLLAFPRGQIQLGHDRLFLSAGTGSKLEVGRLHRFGQFGIDGFNYGPATVVVSDSSIHGRTVPISSSARISFTSTASTSASRPTGSSSPPPGNQAASRPGKDALSARP